MATSTRSIEFTLSGRVVAWLAGLATGAAWIGDNANARLAAAMLVAPLLVDFLLKPRRLHETRIRLAPRRTVAGAAFTERLVVEHAGRLPLRECLVAEPRTMRTEPPALLVTLRAGTPGHVSYRARSLQRSHIVERVFVLMSMWPLGMFRARAIVAVAADLVTEPPRIPLSVEVVRAIAERQAAHVGSAPLPGADFHSLREHLPEEDARAVHALRSASLGTLVRRVTQGQLPHTAGLVLDLRRPPGRPLHQGARRFEWSLAACASLVAELRRRAARVIVLVIDAEPVSFTVQGPAQETDLLTLLSEATPAAHHPLRPDVFDALRRLEHCFWIPAGAYMASPEVAAMPGVVTVVGGDFG